MRSAKSMQHMAAYWSARTRGETAPLMDDYNRCRGQEDDAKFYEMARADADRRVAEEEE